MIITVENERFFPGVIADKIHMPSPTIPLSVPEIVYATESGVNIEFGGSGVLRRGVIGDNRARAEVVQVQIHGGFAKLRGLVISQSVAGSVSP